jgi:hypothetical protein
MKKYIVFNASTEQALVSESPITWGQPTDAIRFLNSSEAVQKAKDVQAAIGEPCGMKPVED